MGCSRPKWSKIHNLIEQGKHENLVLSSISKQLQLAKVANLVFSINLCTMGYQHFSYFHPTFASSIMKSSAASIVSQIDISTCSYIFCISLLYYLYKMQMLFRVKLQDCHLGGGKKSTCTSDNKTEQLPSNLFFSITGGSLNMIHWCQLLDSLEKICCYW